VGEWCGHMEMAMSLVAAAESGDVAQLRRLVAEGFDVNSQLPRLMQPDAARGGTEGAGGRDSGAGGGGRGYQYEGC
jgi:hypothetical protein